MRHRVVLVPFPFDDLSGQKVRPAVCLTDPIGMHRHVTLAFVTSVVPVRLEYTDVLLLPSMPEFIQTGLRVPSAVRLHRVVTITVRMIHRQLGTLAPSIQTQVAQKLRVLFAI